MSTPTVIKHKTIPGGFAQVISYFERSSFCVCVQFYKVNTETGRTCLGYDSGAYSSEQAAYLNFEAMLKRDIQQ